MWQERVSKQSSMKQERAYKDFIMWREHVYKQSIMWWGICGILYVKLNEIDTIIKFSPNLESVSERT
jgi:hypothetical protein